MNENTNLSIALQARQYGGEVYEKDSGSLDSIILSKQLQAVKAGWDQTTERVQTQVVSWISRKICIWRNQEVVSRYPPFISEIFNNQMLDIPELSLINLEADWLMTGNIDFLKISDMTAPVMRFVDAKNRPGLVFALFNAITGNCLIESAYLIPSNIKNHWRLLGDHSILTDGEAEIAKSEHIFREKVKGLIAGNSTYFLALFTQQRHENVFRLMTQEEIINKRKIL